MSVPLEDSRFLMQLCTKLLRAYVYLRCERELKCFHVDCATFNFAVCATNCQSCTTAGDGLCDTCSAGYHLAADKTCAIDGEFFYLNKYCCIRNVTVACQLFARHEENCADILVPTLLFSEAANQTCNVGREILKRLR
jgi:hypothetical protein